MSQNPHRRVVVVSAISGVLVFGAAGFAAAATGTSHKVQAPVIAPAAATDPAVTDAVAGTGGSVLDTLVGDDDGTEVQNSNSTEVENTEGTEVENETDDENDDQGDDHGGGNSGQGNQGGGDHGGDNGGGGDGD